MHIIIIQFQSYLCFSFLFPRFSVSDRVCLPGPESVSAVVQDPVSHLLVSLQRDTRSGTARTPQHTLFTPHTILPAACTVGA